MHPTVLAGFKHRLSAPRAVLAVLAIGAVTAAAVQLEAGGGEPSPAVTTVHYTAVADFSNDRRLAGFAEHVFFGRVTGAGRTTESKPLPVTEFPVQVISTLKGSPGVAVTVAQRGGELPGVDDQQVLLEGDQPLQANQTYLFATRTDAKGRRFLVPQYGDLRVRDAAHQEQLRARFDDAVKNQIPFR